MSSRSTDVQFHSRIWSRMCATRGVSHSRRCSSGMVVRLRWTRTNSARAAAAAAVRPPRSGRRSIRSGRARAANPSDPCGADGGGVFGRFDWPQASEP
eukprot:4825009-Prymnesium_polylepis.1